MHLSKSVSVLLVVGLLLIACMDSTSKQNTQRMAAGVWGGPHISIDVGSESAKVEYDCAHGVIEGPLDVDSEGKFQWRGTFTPERGGPIRADESARAQPATYSGEINGNTMKLSLKLSGSDETETFTLEKGKPGRLVKCK